MVGIAVEIRRYVDDAQPGRVECAFTDAHGREWLIVEKVPIVTAKNLDAGSPYPQPGVIACEVIGRRQDGGLPFIAVDTEQPWHVASTTGQSRFEVRPEQLIQCD